LSSAGVSLLHSIIVDKDSKAFLHLGLTKDDFGINESDLFTFLQEHLQGYGQLPAIETVETQFGMEISKPCEPLAYYHDIVRKKSLQRNLKKSLLDTSSTLQDMNPDKALKDLTKTVLELTLKTNGKKVLDFRESKDIILELHQTAATSPEFAGLRFGWDFLDASTGGIRGGDMLSIVGRPCMGKTFLLLFTALNAWANSKVAVMFVSMEMKPELIFQRLAAMFTGLNLTKLMNAELSTPDFGKLMGMLSGIDSEDMPPFYVIDGNLSASVNDIYILARQLKPEALFIDGAYLVRHADTRLNKYARIEANCELFKTQLAGDLDIPVCLSYQFNRDATKVKKDESASLEHIAGSDAIGQLSSVVLGLMQEDNIETLFTREVSVLKGRNGEIGSFRINWDFNKMDFSQVKDFDYTDLDVV